MTDWSSLSANQLAKLGPAEVNEILAAMGNRLLSMSSQPTILNVPYLSQWGDGADERRGDCGPACVAMWAHFATSWRPTVNQAAAACGQPKTGEGSRYTTSTQLISGASVYGLRIERVTYFGTGDLENEIDDSAPLIALIDYGTLRDLTNEMGPQVVKNQDQNYTGDHWVLVVGYTDLQVVINDPDFWGDRASDGDHRTIPWGAFEAAWGDCDNLALVMK